MAAVQFIVMDLYFLLIFSRHSFLFFLPLLSHFFKERLNYLVAQNHDKEQYRCDCTSVAHFEAVVCVVEHVQDDGTCRVVGTWEAGKLTWNIAYVECRSD